MSFRAAQPFLSFQKLVVATKQQPKAQEYINNNRMTPRGPVLTPTQLQCFETTIGV